MEPVNDSFTVHTGAGSLFLHGLGEGHCWLLVEWGGKNMSVLLDPEKVAELAEFCHLVQGGGAVVPAPEPVPEPKALPPATRHAPTLGVAPDGTDIDYREVARAYCAPEARDYRSERLGVGGRTAYVADRFGISPSTAGGRVAAAVALNYMARSSNGRRNRGPRLLPEARTDGSS